MSSAPGRSFPRVKVCRWVLRGRIQCLLQALLVAACCSCLLWSTGFVTSSRASWLLRPSGQRRATTLRSWFEEFVDSGYDLTRIFAKPAERSATPREPRTSGDEKDDALSKIRDLLGSQENLLSSELTGLRSQLTTLDDRFSDMQQRLKDSEEREGLLGKRLTVALKQERELTFALDTAKHQYENVADELETLQLTEAGLKSEISALREKELALINAEVVREKELALLQPLRDEKDKLLAELEDVQLRGTQTEQALLESKQREAVLQEALAASTEQMSELVVQLADSREREKELEVQLSQALDREKGLAGDLQASQDKGERLTEDLEVKTEQLEASLSAQERLATKLDETLKQATRVAAELTTARKHELSLMKDLEESMDREAGLLKQINDLSIASE